MCNFELLSQPLTLLLVSLVLSLQLTNMCDFDAHAEFFDLGVLSLYLAVQLPYRPLVAVDELLGLCMDKAWVDTTGDHPRLVGLPVKKRHFFQFGRVMHELEGCPVHVLKHLVFLDNPALQHFQLRAHLAILVL